MKTSEEHLTELRFKILDGMADDYEDVEQLYLSANRELERELQANITSPLMLISVRFNLVEVMDEIANMLREGYIYAKHSDDEQVAPLQPLNFSSLHHYWFGATEKGKQLWKAKTR